MDELVNELLTHTERLRRRSKCLEILKVSSLYIQLWKNRDDHKIRVAEYREMAKECTDLLLQWDELTVYE